MEIYAFHRGQGNVYTLYALFPSLQAMQNHGRSKQMDDAAERVDALLDGVPDVDIAQLFAAKGLNI